MMAAGAVLVAGCAAGSAEAAPKVALPPVDGQVDYQLGGGYAPPKGTKVVVRDRAEKPAAGVYSVCYVNAFQTQASEAGFWAKRPELLLKGDDGKPVVDPDWPDEHVLDTSTKAKRDAIATIEFGWIDGCAAKGFKAVDPDNLDTWQRFPGKLSRSGNLALVKLLAERAHARGMAIGQKNSVELGRRGKDAGLDFAVVEECQVYDECDGYLKVFGRHVIEIEYTTGGKANFAAACEDHGNISIVYRDLDLMPKGAKGYVYAAC